MPQCCCFLYVTIKHMIGYDVYIHQYSVFSGANTVFSASKPVMSTYVKSKTFEVYHHLPAYFRQVIAFFLYVRSNS